MVSMILQVAVAAANERTLAVELHVDVMNRWIQVLSARRDAEVCREHVWAVALRDPLLVLAEQADGAEGGAVLLLNAAAALVKRLRPGAAHVHPRPDEFSRSQVDELPPGQPHVLALWFEGEGEERELHFRVEGGLSAILDVRIVASVMLELELVAGLDAAHLRYHLEHELSGARSPEVQRSFCH